MNAGRSRWTFEARLLVGALVIATPALVALLVALLAFMPDDARAFEVWGAAVAVTFALALFLRKKAVYPLYTLSNLLEALREGDYSLRGAAARRHDAVGEVVREVNALAQTLRDQRLRSEEASALLGKIVAAIDIALFGFDAQGRLHLVNPAGERLLGRRATAALGEPAEALGLHDLLDVQGGETRRHDFPGASGRVTWLRGDGLRLEQSSARNPAAVYPDGGCPVELWLQYPLAEPLDRFGGLHPNAHLVEMELLSPLVEIPPGGRHSLDVAWRLDRAR